MRKRIFYIKVIFTDSNGNRYPIIMKKENAICSFVDARNELYQYIRDNPVSESIDLNEKYKISYEILEQTKYADIIGSRSTIDNEKLKSIIRKNKIENFLK